MGEHWLGSWSGISPELSRGSLAAGSSAPGPCPGEGSAPHQVLVTMQQVIGSGAWQLGAHSARLSLCPTWECAMG